MLDSLKYGKIVVGVDSLDWQYISCYIPLLPSFKYRFVFTKDKNISDLELFLKECGVSYSIIEKRKWLFWKQYYLYINNFYFGEFKKGYNLDVKLRDILSKEANLEIKIIRHFDNYNIEVSKGLVKQRIEYYNYLCRKRSFSLINY